MTAMTPAEASHLRRAAARALRTHPGPIGELLHRELLAWQDFGHRFGGGRLSMRVADEILAAPLPPGAQPDWAPGLRPVRAGDAA
ncbi:hypothetical protein GCM10010472_37960 [Pseudonocardia halophobica]|uniref:Uncharacterized protein n=1 Tax=Pseudonocardia halophobica TaxID=29401 RepID=A0A9W6L6S4_9PSEU|nr:hypothetical protein [Pseudonocardia halophobica]GLL14122.1 hypothetical protein GCM10017577_52680 [Pseudonocardia halophobica]